MYLVADISKSDRPVNEVVIHRTSALSMPMPNAMVAQTLFERFY